MMILVYNLKFDFISILRSFTSVYVYKQTMIYSICHFLLNRFSATIPMSRIALKNLFCAFKNTTPYDAELLSLEADESSPICRLRQNWYTIRPIRPFEATPHKNPMILALFNLGHVGVPRYGMLKSVSHIVFAVQAPQKKGIQKAIINLLRIMVWFLYL